MWPCSSTATGAAVGVGADEGTAGRAAPAAVGGCIMTTCFCAEEDLTMRTLLSPSVTSSSAISDSATNSIKVLSLRRSMKTPQKFGQNKIDAIDENCA